MNPNTRQLLAITYCDLTFEQTTNIFNILQEKKKSFYR